MASSALIPAINDVMSLKSGLQSFDESHHIDNAQLILNHIEKHGHAPGISRQDSNVSPIRRSTSAQSVNSTYTRNRQHFQRSIEYLQEQHKQTLVKLHREVQELKWENKKLHFKILVEDEGGAAKVVRDTLAINPKKTNISDEILLQETIKDLKVKLNLSQDTIQHHAQTVKTLNKQLKLLKRVPHPPSQPKTSRHDNNEKDKLILALKEQSAQQQSKIEELQATIKSLRDVKHSRRDNSLNFSAGSTGSPRSSNNAASYQANFLVTNSSRTNIAGDGGTSLKTHAKLPPIHHVSQGQIVGTPNTSPRSSALPMSSRSAVNVVPKNSRVDIAKRTRKVNAVRLNNIDLNEDT